MCRSDGQQTRPISPPFFNSQTHTFQNGFEFQRKYEDILNQSSSGHLDINVPTIYAQQCYDATWTLAKALNTTIDGEISSISVHDCHIIWQGKLIGLST